MTQVASQKAEAQGSFRYNGFEHGKGVNYTTFDYVPVSKFTPLSGTNWFRLNSIVGQPVFGRHAVDLNVECVCCNNPEARQNKVLRIEIVSYEKNIFRVRFNPYAEQFSDYDARINTYGPITRNQLDWIQQQDTCAPQFSYEDGMLSVTLKDVVLNYSSTCFMNIYSRHTGQLLHSDGWVTPPGMSSAAQPQGIVFVDEQYGSAVAAIKNLPTENDEFMVRYYGCGECQNYYETNDEQQNHTSSLEHTGEVLTFFNYDNYEMDQSELKPEGDTGEEGASEQSFIPQYTGAPFMIEYSKDCSAAYGLLLDNTSQTYFNFGNKQYSGAIEPQGTINIDKVYYFGAQYPELDYYLIFPCRSDESAGRQGLIESVLNNYTLLMGKEHSGSNALNLRGAMPPKYIFGFFQGVYGFSGLDSGNWSVESVVNGYKNQQIPLEGLAIDVDVQDNYEVFTTNENFWKTQDDQKQSVFQWAHQQKLVCQTNITNFIRNDLQDYCVFDSIEKEGLYTKCSIPDCFGQQQTGEPYEAILPYTGTTAVFPNFGLPGTPQWWGRNYWDESQVPSPLLSIGLDFVWQDMTVPAMSPHILGEKVDSDANNDRCNWDLDNNTFNWKTYHGQQLYPDPRHSGQTIPYIALRNFHAYMECKATYEHGLTVKGHYPSRFNRSYIISRGGYLGLAHFGGFWTGDNASGWKYMQIEVPKVLNMGLCGFPVVGADVGGFAPDVKEDGKYNHCQEFLMTRWTQAACLLPWFRDHYVNENHAGKAFQELYNFNWSYNGRLFSEIMNDFVKLRVRWHHLLYDAMYRFCQAGTPPVKATCLYEGGSSDFNVMKGYDLCQDSQYFVGDSNILIAPAMEDQNCDATENYPTTIENHPVWLPNGRKWFPYDARFDGPADPDQNFTYTEGTFGCYEGDGQKHSFTVPLENLPIFIREGAIIPTRQSADNSVKNIQQLDEEHAPLIFDIWPSHLDSEYQCYLDDSGKTREAELNGAYSLVSINQCSSSGNWVVQFRVDRDQHPLPGSLYLRLRAATAGIVSDSQGHAYAQPDSLVDFFNESSFASFHDPQKNEQWIKVSSENLNQLTITKAGTFHITPRVPSQT